MANRRLTQTKNHLDSNWNKLKGTEGNDINNPLIDDSKLLDFISPKSEAEHKLYLNTESTTEPIILEKSQITFDNVKNLRDGFLYVGPHDFTKALTLPEAAIHDLQAARPQPEINTEQEPVFVFYVFYFFLTIYVYLLI